MLKRTQRKLFICTALTATAALTIVQLAAMPAPHPRHLLAHGSVWDSIYSAAQAGRGEATFRATCANCHGDSLTGINDAPPLTGAQFHKTWDGNALSSFFNRINSDMPSDNPGSLSKPQVAEVIAFVLKFNGYPAGTNDLAAAPESLSQIRFLPKP